MIEWIVIFWWTLNPCRCPDYPNWEKIEGELWHVSISSDTKTFSEQWNSLGAEDRKNATVIKGNKYLVLSELKLVQEKSKELH